MNKRQKIALGVGGGLLVLCLIFPPWLVTGYSIIGPTFQIQEHHHAGYASIFIPPTVEETVKSIAARIDESIQGKPSYSAEYKVGNRTFTFRFEPPLHPQVQIDILRLSIQSIVVVIGTTVAFFLLKGP